MVMKSLVFFLLALSTFSQSVAQSFAPIGAEWHYDNWHYDGFTPIVTTYHVKVIADTLVDGHSCALLNNGEILRSDSDRVFRFTDGEFSLLYDFAAMPGQVWTVTDPLTWCSSLSGTIRVDSVGSSVINGLTLRHLWVSFPLNDQWGFEPFDPDANLIIERIGPMGYMIPKPYCVADEPYVGSLRCYEDDDLGHYETGIASTCDYTSVGGVGDLLTQNDSEIFSVYPNPASDACHLRFPPSWAAAGMVSMDVVNSIGATVYSTAVSPKQDTATIGIGHLGPGLYTIQLRTSQQHHAYLRIIVH
jgi:hypothetical protein